MIDDGAVYVWGCYTMGLALALVELLLLFLRDRSIRGYLGEIRRRARGVAPAGTAAIPPGGRGPG